MKTMNDDVCTFDFVIVGGGTSGAVVARRLAESKENYSICLVEAGPTNEDLINSRMPGGLPALFEQGEMFWGYNMVPQSGCKNRALSATRGRFLGGCSGINGTVFTRGAKADYDRIEKMGNPGWSWNDMLPYFKVFETFHPKEWHEADLSAHGFDGPLHTEPHPLAPISEKVLESFIDQGFDYKPDMFVQGDYEGVGHAVRTIHNGIRSTSADFINRCDLPNLTLMTNVYVDRILLEPKSDGNQQFRAIGIEAHNELTGQTMVLRTRREVILSAGAYNSPMILMHSGIGPKDHLKEIGIDCKVNLPGVGENLQDHPIVFTSYQLRDVNLTLDRFFYGDPNMLAVCREEWQAKKTGIMSKFAFGCFAFARIDKTIQDPVWENAKHASQSDDPTGQWTNQPHIEYFNTEFYCFPTEIGPQFPAHGESVFNLITLLCGQQARGTVRLSSNDSTSKPIIDHSLLKNELDIVVLAEGCRVAHEVLMNGSATKDIILGPWPKTASYPTTLNEWKEHVKDSTVSCCHASGTCKMAPDSDPMGVVDNRLRVYQVKDLRVADVSIMPMLNSGHPQAPAFAIGEKLAHMVLEDQAISSNTFSAE